MRCDDAGMGMDGEKTWLTYAEAAKRVKSNHRTVRMWAQQGMPVEWAVDEGGQRHRVVELEVLLKWWREKMHNSPAHFYRMRKRMAEEGVVLEMPDHIKAALAGRKRPGTRQGTRVPGTPERPGDERTEPETAPPEPKVDPLAEMPRLKGSAEYWALTDRLRTTRPACAGMPEYTADRITAEDRERLAGICAGCPLIAECRAFAIASKPTGGFWPVEV